MNGRRKQDKPAVATKCLNKAGAKRAAEGMEPRGLAKGKSAKQNMDRIHSQKDMQSPLERERQAARKDKELRFTSLLHHVHNLNAPRSSFWSLKKDAAPGVDGET